MGVLPTPNHLALVRDCYPPHNSRSTAGQQQQQPRTDELPHAVSNAVSKLAFYAVNRPAKLPKVVASLTERATRARGPTSTTAVPTVKDRVELAVTCDILRTLVIECAESGNQGSAELVKSALAEPALSVADMALGGTGVAKPAAGAAVVTAATASPMSLPRPDAELEARGASLVSSFFPDPASSPTPIRETSASHAYTRARLQFHAVATMTTPPFFGFGLAARQYQRCLATLSARVQLTGPDNSGFVRGFHEFTRLGSRSEALTLGRTHSSRYVALRALEGAARSDVMFATGSDFDRQVAQVAPALFYTCLESCLSELESE